MTPTKRRTEGRPYFATLAALIEFESELIRGRMTAGTQASRCSRSRYSPPACRCALPAITLHQSGVCFSLGAS